jgi:NADH-quinone oxidoreductase subunit E
MDSDKGSIGAVIDAAWEAHVDPTGRTLAVLNAVQERFRYIPEEALEKIAEMMGTPEEGLREFAAFFSAYSLEPVGKCLIEVCDGTACHAVGSTRLIRKLEMLLGIDEGQTTQDGMFTIRRVHCVGSCSVAPVVVAEKQIQGRVRISELPSLVDRG